MTVLARRFASTPARTTSQTWAAIIDVIAPDEGDARAELRQAGGLMAMLIADEVTRSRPIVISGPGPMIRVYTLHGEDAFGDDVNEAALSQIPTAGSWKLAVCVADDEIEWLAAEFEAFPHLTMELPEAPIATTCVKTGAPLIDLRELRTR